ncbi:hypothetical protein [Streptomyces mangrovisoli]|uniref:Uncharacterized protein n=1 Tax=Streptomyces mangrovisoli TaxID=1428628 RepID=A0A1J4NPW8_9ACTN|nr:hypothetical protein [Streptomyces mangrovisoli]OIJ64415.1 hypothetical protein WN71_029050 [Streptomyces mangrovisoli]
MRRTLVAALAAFATPRRRLLAAAPMAGLGLGALLILGATRYERLAYPHGDAWCAAAALGTSIVLGLAGWAATGGRSAVAGWALTCVFLVHAVTGTFAAEARALRERGVEVTATVRQEHVHRDATHLGRTDTSYSYDLALPAGLPRRALDTGGNRLAVGARVRVTVDPQDKAPVRLGPRPGRHRFETVVLRVCDGLFLLVGVGLAVAAASAVPLRSDSGTVGRPVPGRRPAGS